MSRPLKCSKFPEGREHENIDRISSLPDELLVDILSILPTNRAVKTSILSSRWRCLHMFTNCLSFDGYEMPIAHSPKTFSTFVNKVLLSHKVSPIKKCYLRCYEHNYADSQLHAWISGALSKRVEQLHLNLGRRVNGLPDCIFTSQTIVELKIDSIIRDLQVPESIHLPNLKTLHLSHVDFVDKDSFDRFFLACPLLQELVMKYCTYPNITDRHVRVSLEEVKRFTIYVSEGWFEIDSSKLVNLNIHCSRKGCVILSLKNPDYLVTAHVEYCFIHELQHALVLIKAIHHVKELYLRLIDLKCFPDSEDLHLPSYPNLVKLGLRCCWPNDGWKYVGHLLVNSPRLETIVFDNVFDMGISMKDVTEGKWPEFVPFSSCVKVIEVSNFLCSTRELVFLKYLLGNANELNMLILKCPMTEKRDKLKRIKRILEARKKLLKFPRASETCIIQLRATRIVIEYIGGTRKVKCSQFYVENI